MVRPFEYRFRVILIGDHGAGKSSLVEKFTTGKFTEPSEPTIGADFCTKIIELEGGARVKLEIWDTAGQDKFLAITQAYYRDSVGVLLVYDICKRDTFEHVTKWMTEARTFIEPHEPVFVMVGCKSDLTEAQGADCRAVSAEEARIFAEQYDIFTIETSAKSGQHISVAFVALAQEIYDRVQAGRYDLEENWQGIRVGPIDDEDNQDVVEKLIKEPPEKKSKCCYCC